MALLRQVAQFNQTPVLTVSLREVLSEGEREVERRSKGIDHVLEREGLSADLEAMFTSIDIFDNNIDLMLNRFVSPLSSSLGKTASIGANSMPTCAISAPSRGFPTSATTTVSAADTASRTKHPIDFYARRLCVSPNYMSALVKCESGLTVLQWIDRALVREAKVLLHHTQMPVAEVAEKLGFATSSFFIRFFRQQTGQTPLQYRKQE